jgi:uncharacterized protein (TIGR02246 family)
VVKFLSTNLRNISATERKQIEAAIRDVFEAGCTAWNRGDLDGYLSTYWDSDKTLWISSRSVTRGRKAIVESYKSRFSSPQQMGRLTVVELEIDVLTLTDAIAFGRWMLVVGETSSKGFFTVQLRKIEGSWLFVSDHSSSERGG